MHDAPATLAEAANPMVPKGTESARMAPSKTHGRNLPARTGKATGIADKSDEKVSKLTLLFYALTVPFRLALVFVCAVALILGICILSVCGGER